MRARPVRQAPNPLLMAEAALGLALCRLQQEEDAEVLSVCREARKLGLETNVLLELPCRVHVKRHRVRSMADVDDLLAWLERRDPDASTVADDDVEPLLRSAARPWIREAKDEAAAGAWLRVIAAVRPSWQWPELHLAEWARRTRDFPKA